MLINTDSDRFKKLEFAIYCDLRCCCDDCFDELELPPETEDRNRRAYRAALVAAGEGWAPFENAQKVLCSRCARLRRESRGAFRKTQHKGKGLAW